MNERQQVSPEVLVKLGLDPQGFSVEWNGDGSRVQKVLGKCPDCGISRFAYRDRVSGVRIRAMCPKPGQVGSESCIWGGRGTLPLGEE
ncbi:hypothetical protein A2714_04890 [Candidatus Woesebacteria bacterium RIFCSPHIGHO2_01_FULL_38_9]|uniref:Uncharacterized protein n=1 Tax=Candidatus Woesebacteria bacterium RIFCSPHIGHO2_01_FULL_38_9 TaxID=1802492 RepID=A0A1F7Y1H2_9BACT|nr:MAG: hypothetical protein A2714_04890 [Candidatus Woesebacteria bacterium RIFCSPHIGHO2_01_FULL_38_9]